MSTETDEARVLRICGEVVAAVFDEIAVEDKFTPRQRSKARDLLINGIQKRFATMPLAPCELAFARLSDEDMRATMRKQIEPVIRAALAPERPS